MQCTTGVLHEGVGCGWPMLHMTYADDGWQLCWICCRRPNRFVHCCHLLLVHSLLHLPCLRNTASTAPSRTSCCSGTRVTRVFDWLLHAHKGGLRCTVCAAVAGCAEPFPVMHAQLTPTLHRTLAGAREATASPPCSSAWHRCRACWHESAGAG